MMINFSKLKKIGDIDYFQGPFLSLFVDEQQGNLYLCSWLKKLDISHLWLVFRVNSNDILAYMQRGIDHLELSKRSTDEIYHLVEIGANAVVLNTKEISKETFVKSPNLMAKAGLFFDEDCCEDEKEIRAFLNRGDEDIRHILRDIQESNKKILFEEPISSHNDETTSLRIKNLLKATKKNNLYAEQST